MSGLMTGDEPRGLGVGHHRGKRVVRPLEDDQATCGMTIWQRVYRVRDEGIQLKSGKELYAIQILYLRP